VFLLEFKNLLATEGTEITEITEKFVRGFASVRPVFSAAHISNGFQNLVAVEGAEFAGKFA
jgi:hypothetical protein